jgi:choline dehydrogenase-like flavoprotein
VNGPRLAVVGSGPAGLGVLTGLLDAHPSAEITLFDPGVIPEPPPFEGTVEDYYDGLYRRIWREQPRAFPPPKTHFGAALPRFRVAGKGRVLRSETRGGLSNFWGGTCLPFTDRELAGWPVDRAGLDPHYRRMAEVVGISGAADPLDDYFGDSYVSRPPMRTTRLCAELEAAVNGAHRPGVVAGVNRCALETRADQPNGCVACGECMVGCFRGAIFSSATVVQATLADGRVRQVVGKVRRFDPSRRRLETDAGDTQSFDRVYLAAGCPNTTEIVLRSLGAEEAEPMADNSVYVFPIVHPGRVGGAPDEPYLALTNLLIGVASEATGLPFAQAQIYTNFDYMWRYNVPPPLWPAARRLVAWSRGRVLWGRLYVDSSLSQSYSVRLAGDRLDIRPQRSPDRAAARRVLSALRPAVNREGFLIPPVPPLLQRSGTHYASTLPYGGRRLPVGLDGQVAPGIYVCDSSVFPSLPAVSLTFTIMANARRIAVESL